MSHTSLRRLIPHCAAWTSVVGRCARIPERGVSGSGEVKDAGKNSFDVCLLEFLVCPLSKKQLRYEEKTNELINDELGIAYPIHHGIPNMIPQDARLIKHAGGAAKPTGS